MTPKQLVATRPDLITEAQLSGLVADVARLAGWTLRYHTLRSKGSPSGFPDWVLVRTKPVPRIVFAELKSEDGQPSEKQREWLDALSDVPNVEVYLWRPSDWDEITFTLTGRQAGKQAAA